MANALTLARILVVFLVIAIWERAQVRDAFWLDLAAVPLLAGALSLDALDGWVARRRREVSNAGALFDIAGDRIVELALWTFFAIRRDANGLPLVSFWVPLALVTRTVLTDFIRSAAFMDGRTPFGPDSMHTAGWAWQLTASRWSRSVYGTLKGICFCGLGLAAALPRSGDSDLAIGARVALDILVYLTIALAMLRGIPVVWDGRRYFWSRATFPADAP